MMNKELIQGFDGYDEIVKEGEVCRKYGIHYAIDKGTVEACVRRLHPRCIRLKVLDVRTETPSTATLRLAGLDHPLPPFQAGQYTSLTVETGGLRTSRPYSISSSPSQIGHWEITVKRTPNGLVSNYLLDQVKIGDVLESSGPTGLFHHNPLFHDPDMVCIAGGSGVTPFMSMIQEMADRGLDRKITLFHGARTSTDVIFHERLLAIEEKCDNFKYIPVIEKPRETDACAVGLIRAGLIREVIGGIDNKTFYLCGPFAMYDHCLKELRALGAPKRKIRTEVYGPPKQISQQFGWPQNLSEDQVFQVKVNQKTAFETTAGRPLLVALEENKLAPPSRCRSGQCSLCRVRVVAGMVFQPPFATVRRSDQRFGYVHSCVSYPLTDLEIVV